MDQVKYPHSAPQPSYPKTTELPHSSPRSIDAPNKPEDELDTIDEMAPPEGAPVDSHMNELPAGQADRPDTKAVNPGSIVRTELEPGPGGTPHHP